MMYPALPTVVNLFACTIVTFSLQESHQPEVSVRVMVAVCPQYFSSQLASANEEFPS